MKRNYPLLIARYGILSIFSIIFVYPFIWMILSSFKSLSDLYTNPWGLPQKFVLENYLTAWSEGNIVTLVKNSLIITSASVLLTLLCALMAAYAFTYLKFRGRVLYWPILICLAIPTEVLMIPLFYELVVLQIDNTYLGLILPYVATNIPFALFILTGFLAGIPAELVEAAKLDGCSNFELFRMIVLPLSRPVIYATGVLIFLFVWNEYPIALVVLTDKSLFTIQLGITTFSGGYYTNYPLAFAFLGTTVIPVILLYVFLQKQFITGLTAGAIKG